MARRIIAQRVLTGDWLAWDVPLQGGSVTRELSGPGGIRGNIAPRSALLLGPDGKPVIEEWSTALYVEQDGQFHGAGIVTHLEENEEGTLSIEAPGFSTYPHGIVHADTFTADFSTDPLDVYRYLWTYVQSFKDGDLGVTVDGLKSGQKMYTQKKDERDGDSQGVELLFYKLPWWEYHDCGEEMDNLLDQANCDYIEKHTWSDSTHTAVNHHITLGIPRVGKKRDDMRFVEGENVIGAVPLRVDGDNFAQNIYATGKGQGRKMNHYHLANRDGRLRRTALVSHKGADQARIEKLARHEYERRKGTKSFRTVIVKDHPNARITSIHPGDDILVEATLSWYGRMRQWVRVTSIEAGLDDNTAVLSVARSDQFRS